MSLRIHTLYKLSLDKRKQFDDYIFTVAEEQPQS